MSIIVLLTTTFSLSKFQITVSLQSKSSQDIWSKCNKKRLTSTNREQWLALHFQAHFNSEAVFRCTVQCNTVQNTGHLKAKRKTLTKSFFTQKGAAVCFFFLYQFSAIKEQ